MKVTFKKAFLKDLQKLPRDDYKKIISLVFSDIPAVEHMQDIKNAKKNSGDENYFRIRVGHYRIGFELRRRELVFMRVLHRKDIYRYFP